MGETSAQNKIRLPIWTYHSDSTTILGLSVGFTPVRLGTNTVTVGVKCDFSPIGLLMPLIPQSPLSQSQIEHDTLPSTDSLESVYGITASIGSASGIVNGLNFNGLGGITRKLRGVSASFHANYDEDMIGFQVAFLANQAFDAKGIQVGAGNCVFGTLRGVQIGIYNRAERGTFLQLGLMNRAGKRHLPLINMNF